MIAGSFFAPVAVEKATKSGWESGNEVKNVEKTVGECEICGFEIYEKESYYYINGERICEDCLREFAQRLLAPFRIGGKE